MNVIAQRWRASDLSSGALETLKWIAFVLMVVDHVDVVMFDRTVPALSAAGRVAMPLFCMVLGYNLSRPGIDAGRLVSRLVTVGLLTQLVAVFTINRGNVLPLNVLWTFAAAVLLWDLVAARQYLLSAVLIVLAALFMDYSVAGVALVIGARAWFQRRDVAGAWALGLGLLALAMFNGSAWSLLSVPLVAAAAAGWLPEAPRLRWWFWIAYPAHMVVLGVLAHQG